MQLSQPQAISQKDNRRTCRFISSIGVKIVPLHLSRARTCVGPPSARSAHSPSVSVPCLRARVRTYVGTYVHTCTSPLPLHPLCHPSPARPPLDSSRAPPPPLRRLRLLRITRTYARTYIRTYVRTYVFTHVRAYVRSGISARARITHVRTCVDRCIRAMELRPGTGPRRPPAALMAMIVTGSVAPLPDPAHQALRDRLRAEATRANWLALLTDLESAVPGQPLVALHRVDREPRRALRAWMRWCVSLARRLMASAPDLYWRSEPSPLHMARAARRICKTAWRRGLRAYRLTHRHLYRAAYRPPVRRPQRHGFVVAQAPPRAAAPPARPPRSADARPLRHFWHACELRQLQMASTWLAEALAADLRLGACVTP